MSNYILKIIGGNTNLGEQIELDDGIPYTIGSDIYNDIVFADDIEDNSSEHGEEWISLSVDNGKVSFDTINVLLTDDKNKKINVGVSYPIPIKIKFNNSVALIAKTSEISDLENTTSGVDPQANKIDRSSYNLDDIILDNDMKQHEEEKELGDDDLYNEDNNTEDEELSEYLTDVADDQKLEKKYDHDIDDNNKNEYDDNIEDEDLSTDEDNIEDSENEGENENEDNNQDNKWKKDISYDDQLNLDDIQDFDSHLSSFKELNQEESSSVSSSNAINNLDLDESFNFDEKVEKDLEQSVLGEEKLVIEDDLKKLDLVNTDEISKSLTKELTLFDKIKLFFTNPISSIKSMPLRLKIMLILGFIIIAVVVVFGVIAFNTERSIKQEINQIEQKKITVEQFRNDFDKLSEKYNTVDLVRHNKFSYSIIGVLKNENEINLFKKNFQKYTDKNKLNGFVVNFDLISEDTLINNAQRILDQNSAYKYIDVYFDREKNRLSLNGFIDQVASLDNLELEFSNKITQTLNIDGDNVYIIHNIKEEFNKIVQRFIANNNIGVEYNFLDRKISVSGYLDHANIILLRDSVGEFDAKYNHVVDVDIKIRDITKSLPFRISEVHAGKYPSIITSDGKRVFVGGQIGEFRLVAIKNNQIIFQGKFPVVLNFGNICENPDQDYTDEDLKSSEDASTKKIVVKDSSMNDKNKKISRADILANELQNNQKNILEIEKQLKEILQHKSKSEDNSLIVFLDKQQKELTGKLQELQKEQKQLQQTINDLTA